MRVRNFLLAFLAAAVALGAAVVFFQERFLFPGSPLGVERAAHIREHYPWVEEITVTAADGVKLQGWLVPAEGPLLIYFGGNSEDISHHIESAPLLAGWSLLLVNSRGYGGSEGKPGQDSFFQDALALYDAAAAWDGVDEGMMAVMGRSIGSGVAVHLAAERKVQGVILISPYDSIEAVAREQFPFLPVSRFLRHPFRVLEKAAGIQAPLLAVIGGKDRVIDPRRSLALVSAWGGARDVLILEEKGHNNLQEDPLFWERIGEFLEGLNP